MLCNVTTIALQRQRSVTMRSRLVVGEWQSTRSLAFDTMRDSWIERGAALGLARVDWPKVAAALGFKSRAVSDVGH
jgi:hypothetical protein